MALEDILLPKMGESVAEATIIRWLKAEGETIEEDEAIVEIATDKVDSEVPSPVEGVLTRQLFQEGDVVKVGEIIASIEIEAGSNSPSTSSSENARTPIAENKIEEKALEPMQLAETIISSHGSTGKFYSPLVKSIAKKEGIQQSELDAIKGSGIKGRVTKKDILAHLSNRGNAPKTVTSSTSAIAAPKVFAESGDEIIEMDRMRKLISDHMVMSKHVAPHVTSFVEADVTNLVLWREKIKKSFQDREGEKITYTPIILEAIAKAIKDFPAINASVDGSNIIIRKNVNIGMATALPTGNLIVPVIKNADELSLIGMAKAVNGLAVKARKNQLKPEDIQGGTYTFTNVGGFGNVMGTPIINQPQVAILAAGAIRKKPAVIETPQGDTIGIRHMMFLSHSYDHRVVDGALGGSFVKRVADYLEDFDINREI